jgi:hypothetical protein
MAEAPSRRDQSGRATASSAAGTRRRIDPAIAWAFACIVLVLLVGSLYSSSFLSPQYLLQQLKVASFLGVIATGAMIVILLGQIDLSVPWVVACRRNDGDCGHRLGTARRDFSRFRWVSAAALRSDLSAESAWLFFASHRWSSPSR